MDCTDDTVLIDEGARMLASSTSAVLQVPAGDSHHSNHTFWWGSVLQIFKKPHPKGQELEFDIAQERP